ncbi:MAG: beta-N-acetylhexosaminidase [Clostridium sp.]|nr:beta-N-acetylhexosaminidase [Clostridium sp.]
MNKLFSFVIAAALACAPAAFAAGFVNLTPAPAQMTVGDGQLTLTKGMTIGLKGQIPQEMKHEADNFVAALNKATGLDAHVADGAGLITVELDKKIPEEGYKLKVTPDGATLKASTAAGLFYGFQTIRKILPANVMAGVAGRADAVYSLPVVDIADQPRFPYRGYMLDVSRHFFDADQVKKMLDVMAMYKMNRFHWHITDDHGWRLPMDKYPELTEKGATSQNVLRTDFDTQRQWRDGRGVQYGPFSYTPEEIRDIVAYAAERHIEVIPEVDLPGHMVAAIHTYPEFSTDPKGTIARGFPKDFEPIGAQPTTHFTHNIWNVGGVSRDVLDVSNPKVMQFVKDVVDQLAVYFPSEYIHIGGDECPTFAWERSESCQALKEQLGLKSDRALQAWFNREIANYARENHGKKIMGWNELISDDGADLDMVRELDPVIFCWVGADEAADQSQKLKLRHIYTPHNGGYYINRCYRGFDKVGAVGDGSLALTYNTNPPENSLCIGVQGSFWTEQVDRNRDLEYLTLPRLQAIAEHGWTPAKKMDFNNFVERMREDEQMMNLAGYNYARHQIRP